jgi:hypothetical protein
MTHPHNPLRTNRFGILLLAVVLAFGAFVYFVPSNGTTTASNPPPVTTGQGTSRIMAPVVDQVRPAPVGCFWVVCRGIDAG